MQRKRIRRTERKIEKRPWQKEVRKERRYEKKLLLQKYRSFFFSPFEIEQSACLPCIIIILFLLRFLPQSLQEILPPPSGGLLSRKKERGREKNNFECIIVLFACQAWVRGGGGLLDLKGEGRGRVLVLLRKRGRGLIFHGSLSLSLGSEFASDYDDDDD